MSAPRTLHSLLLAFVGLALANASCVDSPVLVDEIDSESIADESEPADVAYTDPWYFCVDHPCPNLAAVGFSTGCPVSRGVLQVGVENVGTVDSGASKTTVEFVGYDTRTLDTPGLKANGTEGYRMVWGIRAPDGWIASCKTGVCKWKVRADATDVISEVDGKNNIRTGSCWLP